MENYKALNRDLVLEMQHMRETLQLLNREIFALRGDYMQKHEENIFLRRHCSEIVLQNCCQLLEIIEPDSDVLQYLKHAIFNKSSEALVSDRWSSLARRSVPIRTQTRSRIMADELRRSSSVLKHNFRISDKSPEPRNSYCTNTLNRKSMGSPIESNFSDDNEHSERSFHSAESQNELLNGLHQQQHQQQQHQHQHQQQQQQQQEAYLDSWPLNNMSARDSINNRVDIIYEDDDESDQSDANDYAKDSHRNSKSSKHRSSLTNTHSPSNSAKLNKRKSPRNRNSSTNISDQSNLGKTKSCSDNFCTNNSPSTCNSPFKIRNCDVCEHLPTNRGSFTSRPNMLSPLNASYCGNIIVNDTDKSVQELRNLITSIRIEDNVLKSQAQDNRQTFTMNEVDGTSNISFNTAMNSTSYCRVPFPETPTNQTRPNIDNSQVYVSTRPTLQRVHSTIATSKSDSEDECCNNSNRPLRNCKPLNLREPKLNAKLRNTSEKKSLIKERKTKKGK